MKEKGKIRMQANGRAGELYVDGEIGGFFGVEASDVRYSLNALAREGVELVDVLINSIGGSYTEGIAIAGTMERFPGTLNTINIGAAFSAASVVLQGTANGGTRRIVPGALTVVHEPRVSTEGNETELRAMADRLAIVRDAAVEAYVSRLDITAESIRELMAGPAGQDGTWLTADETVAQGFADAIEETRQASFPENFVEQMRVKIPDFARAAIERAQQQAALTQAARETDAFARLCVVNMMLHRMGGY